MFRFALVPALVVLALLPATAPRAESTSQGFSATLDARVPALLQELTTPGAAVALIEDGEIVAARGYGRADETGEVPVTPSTGFNVGSISKTVTAWGVMRLVENGDLELDAPVSRYLTRWSLPPSELDADGVTVRRLLSHTAGLSLSGYPGWGPDEPLPSLEASLSGATNGSGDVRLIYEPGTDWRYSGGGYTVLQLLVEEVTDRSFESYMRGEVLRPLGMEYSDFEIGPGLLAGSSLAFDELGAPTPGVRFTAKAAAGLHTTVEELARFAAAALEGPGGATPGRGILSPDSVALMTSPAPASDGEYGLGYAIHRTDEGLVLVGHNGANTGWHAGVWVVPETGSGFVVVTNGSNGGAVQRQLWCDWVEELTGSRPSCPLPVTAALAGVLADESGEAAVRHYRQLMAERPEEYELSEWRMNRLGYQLLRRDRIDDAIAIFELNVEEHPESSNPWDSLGEAHLEAAIESYRRSLELDPDNENAARVLERLGARPAEGEQR